MTAADTPTRRPGQPARLCRNRRRFEAEAVPLMDGMYAAAYRLTGDHHDAEDLIQETFARAYLKFHLFRPGTNMRAWLYRIMFRTFCSQCRKRRARPSEVLTGDVCRAIRPRGPASRCTSAEDEAIEKMTSSRPMRALAELPDWFKASVYLADVLGYQLREIAEITGTPLGTAASRIHRGRRMLRLKLGKAPERAGSPPRAGDRHGRRGAATVANRATSKETHL